MVSSTPIPMAMAAMVMVIMSKGIANQPMNPKISPMGTKLTAMAMIARRMERNKSKNIIKIITNTKPSVEI